MESYGNYDLEAHDKKWKAFHTSLNPFPHSFQLEGQDQLNDSTCRRLLHTLQVDLQAGLATSLEVARSRNLLAYMYFLLGDSETACDEIRKVLAEKGEERNLVSLANLASISWQRGECQKAQAAVRQLNDYMTNDDDQFQYLVVKAKAELAYSYTVIGGQFGSKAVVLFEKVIAKARQPELWLWKFGLALTERRHFHMRSVSVLSDGAEHTRLMNVLKIFLEVINKCRNKNLQAKCYSEIALLLQVVMHDTSALQFFEKETKLTQIEACEKALELDSNDPSVLWKCGRCFRYCRRLDESVHLLKKAVDLRQTTAELHHLGLSYKDLAIEAKEINRRYSAGRRRGRGAPRNNRGRQTGNYGYGHNDPDSTTGMCGRNDLHIKGVAESNYLRPEEEACAWTGQSFNNLDRIPRTANRGLYEAYRGQWMNDCGYRGGRRRSRGGHTPQFVFSFRRGGPRYHSQRRSQERYNNPIPLHAKTWWDQRPNDIQHAMTNEESGVGACCKESYVRTMQTLNQNQLGTPPPSVEVSSVDAEDRLLMKFSNLSLNGSGRATSKPRVYSSKHTPRPGAEHPPEEKFRGGNRTSHDAIQQDIQSLRRVVKSPMKLPKLSRSDKFVQEAIDALQEACHLSQDNNTRALYDLALLYRAVGELDEALKLLTIIQLSKKKSQGAFDQINAHEQAGLIWKGKSASECDEERKQKYDENGNFYLLEALRMLSRLCSRLPKLQHFIPHVWHSFHTLLQEAEKPGKKVKDKLSKKASLFQYIKEHYQSLALLEDIRRLTPEEAENPHHLKMCFENYVELEQYDMALTFFELLKCTDQSSAMDEFEYNIYIKAGKAALLGATSPEDLSRAGVYFSSAFRDRLAPISQEDNDSVSAESDIEGNDTWDVILLHHDSEIDKAEVVGAVLSELCGLEVTRMGEDCLPGRLFLDSILSVLSRSRQAVVLAGPPSWSATSQFDVLVEAAVKRPSTLALLLEEGNVCEALLPTTRSMECPQQLLSWRGVQRGELPIPRPIVEAVCQVFAFLVDIDASL